MCKMMTTGLIGLAPRRKRAGFTQQAFADALGIGISSASERLTRAKEKLRTALKEVYFNE